MVLVLLLAAAAESQLPPIINLNQTSADIEIAGAEVVAYCGVPIGAGDIDGDGLTDLVILSGGVDPLGGTRSGELEILWGWGLESGVIDLAVETGAISRVFGSSSDSHIGAKLASGDFNNDGCDDIIFGQLLAPGLSTTGIAYVIFGSPDFPDTLDLQLNPPNVIRLLGQPYGGLGWDVAAGDLNNDGYDEIIAGAPLLDHAEVYIIHGSDTLQSIYNMGQQQHGMTRFIDFPNDTYAGTSLACGDVDDDGFDDVLIGAPEGLGGLPVGGALLFYGQSTLPDTLRPTDVGFRFQRFLGEEALPGRFGSQVAMGEIDGDGALDLIIAASAAKPFGCRECGVVYVFFNDGYADTVYADDTEAPISRVIGEWWYGHCGKFLTCVDLTGDGRDEIVLPNVDAVPEHTFVIYGTATMPDTTFLDTDTLATRIISRSDDEALGRGLTFGYFNDDGVYDLALGADFANPLGRSGAGMTYVLYGVVDPNGIVGVHASPRFLSQNFPNPFHSETVIEYSLEQTSSVALMIYNVMGQRVARYTIPTHPPGRHLFRWNGIDNDGRRVSSGVYFYQLKVGSVSQTRKMLLLR